MKSLLAKNIAWSAYGVFVNQVVSLGTLYILLNKLAPSDFGLVNMILVVVSFATIISDFGFGQAIIQNSTINETDLSTVYWFNLFTGISITIIIFFIAPLLAEFYKKDELVNIARILSIKYVFATAIILHKINLQKDLNFKKLSKLEVYTGVSTSAITVIAAINNFTYWTLVIQSLGESIFSFIYYSIHCKWRPKYTFSIHSIKKLSKFSVDIFFNQSLYYWTSNFDKIIIGKYLGDYALGIYKNAYTIVNKPIDLIRATLLKVLFPSFSQLQNDIPKLKESLLKIISKIILIPIPFFIILFFASHFLITNFLPKSWEASIPIIRIFCLGAIPFAISSITNPTYLALGKSRIILLINIIIRTLLISLIYLFIAKGLIAVSLIVLGINIIRLIVDIIYLSYQLKLKISELVKHILIDSVTTLFTFIGILSYTKLVIIDSVIKFVGLITITLAIILFFKLILKRFIFLNLTYIYEE